MSDTDYITPQAVYSLLLQKVKDAGGQGAFARRFGVHPGLLSETINRKRDITPSITAALGLSEVRRYMPARRAGWPT